MASHNLDQFMLTSSLVWHIKGSNKCELPVPEGILQSLESGYKHVLSIYAPAKEFFKITSYFLKDPKVTKIVFKCKTMDDELVETISNLLKSLPPLHVSGFCHKNGLFIYEAYVPGSKDDVSTVVNVKDLPCKIDMYNVNVE